MFGSYRQLDFIERLVVEIAKELKIDHEGIALALRMELNMSKEMDDLVAEVAQDTDVESKAVTALQGLEAQLADAGTDPVKLNTLRTNLAASRAALAAEIAKDAPPSGGGTTGTGPVIASIGPTSGPAAGGTAIAFVMSGGAASVSAVAFGPNPAASFSVNNDTSITAYSPAGTGTVDVTVTNPDGTSAPLSFTYV